ncbi:FtsW/RodA/SpoVE family cell cycle protein [Vagococcus vulneris]|uniref:FtsW/RodA/SpoVE family cell cycle protein n=1 Tax=Vagococcus vulneris TaxID=1977869 RepID=UPI0014040514|nr:FtsW/RodA/SpoVE family cell cycle protein [Vagococcus vulneris]
MLKKIKFIDFKILIPYFILSSIGIIMILSASSYNLDQLGKRSSANGLKQLMFFLISLAIITIIYKSKNSLYTSVRFQKIIMTCSFMLLIATTILGLGTVTGGAQRWIQIGPISLQPSEFIMLTVILYSSFIFSKREKTIQGHFKDTILGPTLIVSSLILLVFTQPNVGGAAILTLIFLVILFASGIPYPYMIGGFGIMFFFSFIMTQLILFQGGLLLPQKYHYIYDRFSVVKNPFDYQLDNGYQLVNSYFAIYNGGWFGKGLGQSIQKKGFLPVAETDFIFSIITEELGVVAAILILALLLFLILRIIAIGMKATSTFNSLICIGISAALLIQVFVNLGGILGFIPLTGVPFPFMSYGGSNLLTLSIMIGLILNISADEKKKALNKQMRSTHTLQLENSF